jgi:hypothetical protein
MTDDSETQMEPTLLKHWQVELMAEADDLRREIRERTVRLNRIDEQLSLLLRLLELSGVAEDHQHPEAASLMSSREHVLPNGSREFEDDVEELLRGHGEPMHISSIRSALIDAGIQIPGRGDDANIIVRLRRYPDRFTRTARGTYSLTEWGLPELKTGSKSSRIRKTR